MRSSFSVTFVNALLALSLALLSILHPAHGYASWFVERSSSCWVELRDPTEVVMNNFILPHEKSTTPNVKIDLYEKDSISGKLTLVDVEEIDGKRIVYIDDFTKSSKPQFGEDEWSQTYVVKLNYDAHKAELNDLQYVMDVKVSPELDDDELGKLNGSESRIKAEFTSGLTGCRNYRASGRGNDEGLDLKIAVPSSVFQLDEATLSGNSANIIAGYACGHEAVVLTQPILFLPRLARNIAQQWISEAGDRNAEEAVKEEDTQGSLGEDTPNDVNVENSQMGEASHHNNHHGQLEPNIDDGDLMEGEGNEEDKGPNLEEVRKAENLRKKTPTNHKRRHRQEMERSQVRQFKDKYEKEDFGQAKFTANSYLTAIVVFIIVGGTVINALLAISSSKGHKREHTL